MFDDFQTQVLLLKAKEYVEKQPDAQKSSEIRYVLSVYGLLDPNELTNLVRLLSLCQLNSILDIFPLRHVKIEDVGEYQDGVENELLLWKAVIPLLRHTESVTFDLSDYFLYEQQEELFALIVKMPSLQKLHFETWTSSRVVELLCSADIPHISVQFEYRDYLIEVLQTNPRIRQLTVSVKDGTSDKYLVDLTRNSSLEVP
jgi:hypothetical protein